METKPLQGSAKAASSLRANNAAQIRQRRKSGQAEVSDGLKALLTAASLAGTIGGWALLASHGHTGELAAAADPMPTTAVVAQANDATTGASTLSFEPLPTLAPLLEPRSGARALAQGRAAPPLATATAATEQAPVIVAQEPAAAGAAAPAATPTPQTLRSVTLPARRPPPVARTRSSR